MQPTPQMQNTGLALFSGLVLGALGTLGALAAVLLQRGGEEKGVSLERALHVFHEARADPGSVAALVHATGILALRRGQHGGAPGAAPALSSPALPLALPGPAVGAVVPPEPSRAADDSERFLAAYRARAKDRLRALKAMGAWVKEYQEAQKAHSKVRGGPGGGVG